MPSLPGRSDVELIGPGCKGTFTSDNDIKARGEAVLSFTHPIVARDFAGVSSHIQLGSIEQRCNAYATKVVVFVDYCVTNLFILGGPFSPTDNGLALHTPPCVLLTGHSVDCVVRRGLKVLLIQSLNFNANNTEIFSLPTGERIP